MNYILSETNSYIGLAVINLKTPPSFNYEILNKKVSMAVKEHFCCVSVTTTHVKTLDDGFRLECVCTFDDDLNELREIDLTRIAVY